MTIRILLFIFITSVYLKANALSILIDPGHGGSDTGAVRGNLTEAQIALKVSLELNHLLTTAGGYRAFLTRDSHKSLSLQERAEIAESIKPDLFISVHVNASEDRRARGTEFYFQNQLEPSEEMLLIAKTENQINKSLGKQSEEEARNQGDVLSILEDLRRQQKLYKSLHLAKSLKSTWPEKYVEGNSVRQAPFFVVTNTESPSTLIELGFLSNPQDYKKLADPTEYPKMAQRIFEGIEKYKQLIDKTSADGLR